MNISHNPTLGPSNGGGWNISNDTGWNRPPESPTGVVNTQRITNATQIIANATRMVANATQTVKRIELELMANSTTLNGSVEGGSSSSSSSNSKSSGISSSNATVMVGELVDQDLLQDDNTVKGTLRNTGEIDSNKSLVLRNYDVDEKRAKAVYNFMGLQVSHSISIPISRLFRLSLF